MLIPRLSLINIPPSSPGRGAAAAVSNRPASHDQHPAGPPQSGPHAALHTAPTPAQADSAAGLAGDPPDGSQSPADTSSRRHGIAWKDGVKHAVVDDSLQPLDKAGAASRMLAELKERRLGTGSRSRFPSPAAVHHLQASSEALKTNRELQADAQVSSQDYLMSTCMHWLSNELKAAEHDILRLCSTQEALG